MRVHALCIRSSCLCSAAHAAAQAGFNSTLQTNWFAVATCTLTRCCPYDVVHAGSQPTEQHSRHSKQCCTSPMRDTTPML